MLNLVQAKYPSVGFTQMFRPVAVQDLSVEFTQMPPPVLPYLSVGLTQMLLPVVQYLSVGLIQIFPPVG